MALGLGFNKTKVLQTAEKYVLQGKLPAAIEEYQKVLKKDPKDLMTLNTIGDLYVRSGKTDEAVKCFYDLAEKSVEGGFVPRAIAVYKRITKIDMEALPALIRLGELYSMQGLMRDARTHLLQAVEIHMRRRDAPKAREVFEKVLMLDMENPRLQRRMAELYAETGKKPEAIATYLSAAERFLDSKEAGEASNTLEILTKLDPDNVEAQVLRGRVLLEQGSPEKAAEVLQKLATDGASKTVLDSLFHAYRNLGQVEQATAIARRLFDEHDDFAGLAMLADDLAGKGDTEGSLQILQGAAEKLQAQGGSSVLIEGLRKVLKSDSPNIVALELLWGVYRKQGDVGEGRETAELLAHAYVASEQLAQARDVYAELVALEPDNADNVRLLRQVEARMGVGGDEAAATDGITPLIAMEAAAAPDEESLRVGDLPPREQALVKNCLTESELYFNYHQVPKAIETLEKGLLEVPGDASLHEHLLPLYEQTQQYQKAAQCAEALTEIYVKMGDGERSTRYGELSLSYQQKAQEMPAEPVQETASEFGSADAGMEEPGAAEQPQVREVDLSTEWANLSESGSSASSAADSAVEEIEFYLQAGLGSEAQAAISRLREASPDHPALAAFETRLSALLPGTTQFVEEMPVETPSSITSPAPAPESVESASAAVEAPVVGAGAPAWETAPPPAEMPQAEPVPDMQPAMAGAPAPVMSQSSASSEADLALEGLIETRPSAAAGSSFELSLEEPGINHAAPTPAPPSIHAGANSGANAGVKDPFADLTRDFGADSQPGVKAPVPPASAPDKAPAAPPAAGAFLDDIFAEFKEEVGESGPAGEDDLETHYNMGVAFKEMALYDEAIGEFQKVHQLAESTRDYSHVVQCCSLLAVCFLGKGMPELAVKWYQTALNSPGVDTESALALLYEKGSAQETAGDRSGALKSFKEVYARNIDYRNVADRIRDLQ